MSRAARRRPKAGGHGGPQLLGLTRLATNGVPTAAVFQKMDDSYEHYTTEFGTDGKTLAITPASGTGASTVTYQRLSPELLVIEGPIDGRVVRLELTPRDLNSFVLNSRGFNWVQNVPFNR